MQRSCAGKEPDTFKEQRGQGGLRADRGPERANQEEAGARKPGDLVFIPKVLESHWGVLSGEVWTPILGVMGCL